VLRYASHVACLHVLSACVGAQNPVSALNFNASSLPPLQCNHFVTACMIFKSLVCKFFFSLILFRNNPIFPCNTRDKSHGSSSNCEYSSNIRRFATNRTLQSSHLFDSIGALQATLQAILQATLGHLIPAIYIAYLPPLSPSSSFSSFRSSN
jgi:hypothetical protein